MAHAVSALGISIDQAVHGYADGHRLLGGSMKLQGADARTMLVLSDASGGRFDDPEHGYLTGYPLAASSRYVLARTWPAPEMSRPGCVWTHSLLIGFADLATVSSAEGLLSLFRRPEAPIEGHNRQIFLPDDHGASAVTCHPNSDTLLTALYLDPGSKVQMWAGDPLEDERLFLAVWLQQWPRLRRGFRFCSSITVDRSTPTEAFDLQAVSVASGPRRKLISDARLVEEAGSDARLSTAVDDLRHPAGLRAFLRQVGGDVPRGRAAMVMLCQLYDALERVDRDRSAFNAALDAMDALGASQARAARALVLERALSNLEGVDDRAFSFVCDSVAADGRVPDPQTSKRIGDVLWRKSPVAFARSLTSEGTMGSVATRSVTELEAAQLVEGTVQNPEIATTIARTRPEVLALQRFWEASPIDFDALLERVDGRTDDGVLRAIAAANRSDAAAQVTRKFGAARTLEAIGAPDVAGRVVSIADWLRWIAMEPSSLGSPLASGKLAREAVVGLAICLRPDDVPNDYGDDPWAIAARVGGILGATVEDQFAAFLMARALGRRSRSCAELLRMSFDRVHRSLRDCSMPDEGWRLVERRLPWPTFWDEWDRCERVRRAMAAKFVDFDLDPAAFARLTDDNAIFQLLAEIAATSRSGRRYLEKVVKTIREAPDDLVRGRGRILEKLT